MDIQVSPLAVRRDWSTINLVTPDNGEKFVIELENSTLTNIPGFWPTSPT